VRAGILEREAELAVLAGAVPDAAAGHGSVVLISGEAGIGRSSPAEAVRAQLPAEGRMFIGCCDDLATPRAPGDPGRPGASLRWLSRMGRARQGRVRRYRTG